MMGFIGRRTGRHQCGLMPSPNPPRGEGKRMLLCFASWRSRRRLNIQPTSRRTIHREAHVQGNTGIRVITNQANDEDRKIRPTMVVGTPPGTLNFSALASSGDRRRRNAICDSRIMIHTHTVAKVASDAITVEDVLRHDVVQGRPRTAAPRS